MRCIIVSPFGVPGSSQDVVPGADERTGLNCEPLIYVILKDGWMHCEGVTLRKTPDRKYSVFSGSL